MLVYITKPIVHECIMGGFRSLALWTKMPHYHHYPTRINSMIKGEYQYVDRGWGDGNKNYPSPAKPILKQDEDLAEKVWNQITWSCCPKGISFEDHVQWCNALVEDHKQSFMTPNTNFENMLFHHSEGKNADIKSNINYKRFLLEVNLRTNEVKILTPRVHWYNDHDKNLFSSCNKTEETLEIPEKYATEIPYILN